MTIKDKLLARITEQIRVLQEAYNYNKNLPDYIFEGIDQIGNPLDLPTLNEIPASNKLLKEFTKAANDLNAAINGTDKMNPLEYGGIKKSILNILADNGKAMLKSNITDKMIELNVLSADLIPNAVTNALAALNSDGVIKGYKPAGLKFRGYFWTLNDWWLTDKNTDQVRLPLEFEPYIGKIKTF